MPFLPIDRQEMELSGILVPDFILVSGDAYCDHPSFGVAIISRILERHGYSVCILSQPDVGNPEAFLEFGKPRLAWLVTSGNIDSMVNHYTVAKRKRRVDSYTPGGKMGKRPDRATIVYSRIIRKLDNKANIILGGVEASLRRLAHYDYWDDAVRKSVLIDSEANLLVYGMGELAIVDIADNLASGLKATDLSYISGTVYKTNKIEYLPDDTIFLPSFKDIRESKEAYAKSFLIQYQNMDDIRAKTLVEKYDETYVVQNKPMRTITRFEMDEIYDLSYMRAAHPKLEKQGHIKAMDEIKFSLTVNRGCFGNCAFCALASHQGRKIQSRSKGSIIKEAHKIIQDKDFKGYIHDVGGPTANFYNPACEYQLEHGVCQNKDCLGDEPCRNLVVDHKEYLEILRELRKLDGVKKVFVRSGIRYDYVMYDKDDEFFRELVRYHVSGQLKVAPEHVSPTVLKYMGKPRVELYDRFVKKYEALNRQYGKNQYLVPYLMSSHPGSTLRDAVILAEYIRDMNYNPEQVQDFYPTPHTMATSMYYTGIDPLTMKKVYVPKSPHEKALQRALIQYRNPKNYNLVLEALEKTGRMDLVGFDRKSLIKPKIFSKHKNSQRKK